MAILSGFTITEEQARELDSHKSCVSEDEEALGFQHYDLVLEPDGHVTVGCLGCNTILIEFYPETIDTERYGKIAWSIYDVMCMLEDDDGNCPISEEQARDFLIRNEKYLQESTIEQGWEALRVYAEQDKLGQE